jgi:hypothetical protein
MIPKNDILCPKISMEMRVDDFDSLAFRLVPFLVLADKAPVGVCILVDTGCPTVQVRVVAI